MSRTVWDDAYMSYAFSSITEMMLQGNTIKKCFEALKINATTFYRYLTDEQRNKIKIIRKNVLKATIANTEIKTKSDLNVLLKMQQQSLLNGNIKNAALINFKINKL